MVPLMRLFLVMIFIIQGLAFAHADYNNPTEATDCNLLSDRYDFQARLDRINMREMQCSRQQGNHPTWAMSASCGYYTSLTCVPIARQACDLKNHMRVIREQCMARLEIHQAKERERKLLEEQAEREAAKFREAARHYAKPGNMPDEFGPTQNTLRGLGLAGVAARQFSGANLRNAGAMHLSAALSVAGLRAAQGLQAEALNRLQNAMAQINRAEAADPSGMGDMSWARAEATRNFQRQLDAIEGRIEHAKALLEHSLPLGGASAVLSGGAESLSDIVTGLADGSLDGSLWTLDPSAAIEQIEQRRTIENDRAAREAANAEIFNAMDLNGRRRLAYRAATDLRINHHQRLKEENEAQARADNERRAEEARKRRISEPDANHCLNTSFVRREPTFGVYEISNRCSYDIYVSGEDCYPESTNIRPIDIVHASDRSCSYPWIAYSYDPAR